MEQELQDNLFACGRAFAEGRGIGLSTVGRLAAGDGQFFERLRDGASFTARKYDQVIAWFSANWPEGATWPPAVPRPAEAAVS